MSKRKTRIRNILSVILTASVLLHTNLVVADPLSPEDTGISEVNSISEQAVSMESVISGNAISDNMGVSDDAVSDNSSGFDDSVSDDDVISDNAVSDNEAISNNEAEKTEILETISEDAAEGSEICAVFLSYNGISYNKIGTSIYIRGCSANMTELNIPEYIDGAPVAEISFGAFRGNEKLEKVILPKTLKKINDCAFKDCTGLKELRISSDLEDASEASVRGADDAPPRSENSSIFYNAGSDEGFTVTFEEGVTYIPKYFFATSVILNRNWCKISEVHFPSTLKTIRDYSFYDCRNLKKLNFINDAPSIASSAFLGLTLTATYPKGKKNGSPYDGGAKSITWVAIDPPIIPLISISLDKTYVEAKCNSSFFLKAYKFPEAAQEGYTWSSSNEKLATVYKDGYVHVRNTVGTVNIYATSESGKIKATCKINIIDAPRPQIDDPATSGLDPRIIYGTISDHGVVDIYLVKGQTYTLSGGSTPWKSDNSSVVSVSKRNVIKAKKSGVANIKRDGIKYSANVEDPVITNHGFSYMGQDTKMQFVGLDDDFYKVYFLSTNPNVAEIDQTGLIHSNSAGKTKIIAYIGGRPFTQDFTVFGSHGIDKSPSKNSTLTMSPMQSATVRLPGKIKIKNGVWKSDKDDLKRPILSNGKEAKYYQNDVVKVTPSGKITAIGPGKTTLTVETSKGKNTFTVSVNEPTERNIYIRTGQKLNIKYPGVKVTGKNRAIWEVSDSDKAEVSLKGTLKGLSYGQTTLTCTYKPYDQGGFTYKAKVFVESPDLSGEKLYGGNNKFTVRLSAGEKTTVNVSNIYQSPAWKNSNNAIAFIDEFGVIRGRKKGKTNLTLTVDKKKYTIKVICSP